jgi:hypothetical protein
LGQQCRVDAAKGEAVGRAALLTFMVLVYAIASELSRYFDECYEVFVGKEMRRRDVAARFVALQAGEVFRLQAR